MSQDRTQAFVYMKAGHHADEPLEKILERKNREFNAEQRIFWGYGGTLAHPRTQVQPFAKLWARHGNQVQLLMAVTQSKHYSDSPRATEYSVDGEIWKQIPKGISVTGSKHALVIGPLEPVDFELDISEYEVGIGPKENTNAAQYLRYRIDKGCFRRAPNPQTGSHVIQIIKLQARLLEPYAVLVR